MYTVKVCKLKAIFGFFTQTGVKIMEKISDISKEQLVNDFKMVVADAEALLKATANQGGDELAEIRSKAERSLKVVNSAIADAESVVIAKTKEAAHATDIYVHKHPWQSIGTAAAIGVVIGLLIGRR